MVFNADSSVRDEQRVEIAELRVGDGLLRALSLQLMVAGHGLLLCN